MVKKSRKVKSGSRKKQARKKSSGHSFKSLIPHLVIVLVTTLAAMWPVVNADYAELDDQRLLIERVNRVIAQNVPVWKPDLFTPHYKPLVYQTWVWENKLFGMDKTIVHVDNLILHILNTLLIFFLTLRLASKFDLTKKRPELVAVATAVLFGVHPMHVESVAWAVERKDVLYTFFFLGGLIMYLRFTDEKKKKWMFISALLFGASVLSKAPAIVFPFILMLLDYALGRKPGKETLLEKWPVFIVFVFGLSVLGFFGHPKPKNPAVKREGNFANIVSERKVTNIKPISDFPPLYGKVALVGLKGTFWYAHTLFPIRQSIAYPYKTWLPAIGQAIHILPLILLLSGFLIFRLRKKRRFIYFTHAFFFIALLPALIRTGLGRGIFLSDRYVYLASFGLIFLIIGLLHHLMEKRSWDIRRQYAVLGVVVLIYGAMCFSYARAWDNGETLWTNVVEKYPTVSYAWVNRAKYYKDLGQMDKALQDYNSALEVDDDLNGLIDRGTMLRDMGKYDASMADFNRALEAFPDDEFALNGKANLLFTMGRYNEAIDLYTRGISLYPRSPNFYVNRSASYYQLGQVQQAIADLQQTLEVSPGYPGTNQKFTVMYRSIGDWPNTLKYAQLTAKEDPTNHANFGDLGEALQQLGRHQEAIEAYTRAIQIYDRGKRYYLGRAKSYSAIGNAEAASRDRQIAKSL